MTVDEYVAWGAAQGEHRRTELINGRVVDKYPDHIVTVEEYVAWADVQPERQRTELINGQVVPMTPERVEHVEVKAAMFVALKTAVGHARISCHALSDGMTVRVDDYTAYEPDALVYCGERLTRGTLIVPNPIIVAEVLSPTTAHIDTSAKLLGYFKLPSVAHYLVVDPDARSVTHHTRENAPRTMTTGALRLGPPGIQFEISDLFG